MDVALDKTARWAVRPTSRWPNGGPDGPQVNDYRLKVRAIAGGTVSAQLTKVVGGTETAVGTAMTVSGLTYNAGDTLRLRFQVTGTAPPRERQGLEGRHAEPATWLAGTDSTAALQTAGGVALLPYLSGTATNAPSP